MSREIHSSSWCSPSFPGRLSSGGTSKTSTSSHARYSVPAAVFVAFSELISLCFFGLTPAAVFERRGTSGKRGLFRDYRNVIVRQVSCLPEANGSAATDFAPEPNGEAAAPPKGEEVDAVFFASPNGLAAQRTVVSLLGRHRYPSRKSGRATRHVKVILSLLREPLLCRR